MKKKRKHVRYLVHYVPNFNHYELFTASFKRMSDMVAWLLNIAPKFCFYILSFERIMSNED